jgi:predicted outer membrane repeat protein
LRKSRAAIGLFGFAPPARFFLHNITRTGVSRAGVRHFSGGSDMRSLRLVVCALMLACLSAPAAAMVTIKVTTSMDEKNCNTTNANPAACHVPGGMNPLSTGCSLREALQNIDNGNNTSFPECTPVPETGPNAVNIIDLSGAGGTITINGAVPDPTDPTHTAMTHAGTMPNVFPKTNVGTVTILGGDITCASGADAENIFVASAGSDLTLSGVTVHDCTAFGGGLVVRSNGTNDLTVKGSNFLNIKATSTGPGSVISHNGGNLTIGSSSFTNCTQDNGSGGGQGGAVGVSGVAFPNFVTIDSSNFLNNTAADSGGALYLSSIDSITISNDIFTKNTANGNSGNNAEAGGGAIFATGVGKGGNGGVGLATNFFLIFNTQFINNSASNGTGGALVHTGSGDLSLGAFDFTKPSIPGGIVASNFTGNSANGPAPTGIDPRSGSGGAIYAAANLSVLQSSFVKVLTNNSSAHSSGGAIAFYDAGGSLDPLMVVNTTFNDNSADEDGGAIANLLATTNQSGKVMLLNDTLDSNTANGNSGSVGGSFFNANSTATDVNVSNTIFSNAGGMGGNCAGQAFTDKNTNLQFPGTSCGATIPSKDPNLAAPGIFAGPNVFVWTQSLNAGSAASNAGTNSVCNGVPVFTFDGTGRPVIRPSPSGTNCDIGAYESSNAPVYASAPPPASTINISALTTMPMTATVVISNTGNDDLIINGFSTTGGPQIAVAGPATPVTIPAGGAPQTLTLTCSNAVAGNFNGTLTVTHNAAGNPAAYTVNCAVTAPLTPLSITTPSPLPNGSVGAAYTQTFAATGGTPPYASWVTTTPATFPAWATLDPNTGMLTGTPPNTAGSPFTFTIQVSDSTAPTMTASKQFVLTVDVPALSITTASPLPSAMVGSAYNQSFLATGGVPPYAGWIVTTPATFPGWATLNPATGVLTGTPPNTAGSPFTFTVQVSDSNSPATATTKQFTLTVTPPPLSITTTSPLPTATVASAYSQTFQATGGTPPYTNWAVTAGTPPGWATLAAGTGAFTGTPPNTTGSPFTFTVTVTDSALVTSSKVFALQVNAPPLLVTTASPLPGATVGAAYSQAFTASGGVPPYSNWIVIAGTAPAWATLNPATGAFTGTPPDQTGSPFTFTVQVTDNNATTTSKQFDLTVGSTPVTLQDFGID